MLQIWHFLPFVVVDKGSFAAVDAAALMLVEISFMSLPWKNSHIREFICLLFDGLNSFMCDFLTEAKSQFQFCFILSSVVAKVILQKNPNGFLL